MTKHLLIAGALAAVSVFTTAAQAADIKIGALYPITGGGAVYGVPAMLGNRMAVDEINASGGINGSKLVIVERDTKLNPAEAAAAAKELITKDGVNVLIGGLSSGVGLAISEVAKQEKVLYIATIPKTIQMTTAKLHPYVFRTASHTDFEGDAIAQIVKKLGAKKVCDIQLDYAYGHDLAKGIEKAADAVLGSQAESLQRAPKLGATDYNAVISQLIASDCEVVTSGLWGSHFVNFAQQARPFGFFKSKKYVSGGEIASQEIAGKMGADYPDNVWSNTYELWYSSPTPAHKKFQAALPKLQGKKETPMWPVLAWIGVKFYATAAANAKSFDAEKVAKALEGLSIETPVGKRTIDAKTHQANTGQFWGPMVKKKGVKYRMMDPVTFIDAKL